jgi:methyl-accepting chemotaxis protein
MAQDAGEIRETIEQTRDEIAETLQAIGEKADLKARATEKVAAGRDTIKDSAADTMAKVGHVAQSAGETLSARIAPAASSATGWSKSAVHPASEAGRRARVAMAGASIVLFVVLLVRGVRHGRRRR